MLSDKQIDFIQLEIEKSDISRQEIKDDLLDHFCCFIESEMKHGNLFEASFLKAKAAICPNGFDEIEKETIFLLNTNRIIMMKKIMYAIGLIASMSISTGWLFKILHLPLGDELFSYGFIGLVLVFLPMLAFDYYKLSINKVLSERLKLMLGFTSAMLTGLGLVLKIMQLQGADVLIIVGFITFIIGFLPFLFFRMYKKALE